MSDKIVQQKTGTVSNTSGNLVVTFDNNFTPGNSVVIVLSWFNHQKLYADGYINAITDNKGNTYQKRTAAFRSQVDSAYTGTGDTWSEIWDCIGAADAAPATKLAVTIDPKNPEAFNDGWAVINEVTDLVAFSQVGTQSGGGYNASSVTCTTPTLPSAPQFAVAGFSCLRSLSGVSQEWNLVATQARLTDVPAGGCAVRNVDTQASLSATWSYAGPFTLGAAATIATYTVAAGVTLRAKFLLDPALFTSADTGIEGYVRWGNGFPDTELATFYSGLAGDATAGVLYITTGLPSNAVAGQTINGEFSNGTDTSGRIAGVIEAAP